MKIYYITILLLFFFSGCTSNKKQSSEDPVLVGLDGKEYYKPTLNKSQAKLDSNYLVAKQNFDRDPSEENYIWLGRREAYRYNYDEAIEIFSRGLQRYPESYKLYRHRGHRYITVRDFKKAISDLQRAADLLPPDSLEIEPDGQPNK